MNDEETMGFELGPPTPEDAAALTELCRQLGYRATTEVLARRLAVLGARVDHWICVARDQRNTPQGWIHIFVTHHLQSEPYAEIGGMVVAEGRRSAGLGAALLAAAENWARGRGMNRIRVRSNAVRDRAHRFYERKGYARVKTQHVFEKRLA
jgi:GNAT superfamily N-acetyltransferase